MLRPTAQEKTSCSLVGLVGLQGKMPPPELIHTSSKYKSWNERCLNKSTQNMTRKRHRSVGVRGINLVFIHNITLNIKNKKHDWKGLTNTSNRKMMCCSGDIYQLYDCFKLITWLLNEMHCEDLKIILESTNLTHPWYHNWVCFDW